MLLAQNTFTKALKAGDKQIGLWISLANNFAAEVVAPAGYDWALIDMEHSPNDYFSVLGQLQAFSNYSTVPIVRVEWNDAVAVKRLLDLGAPGLLFPMIQTVEEAQRAVAGPGAAVPVQPLEVLATRGRVERRAASPGGGPDSPRRA